MGSCWNPRQRGRVIAAQRVYFRARLSRSRSEGRTGLLAGNTRALAQRQRFLERDLNRGWTTARLDRLRHQPIDPELHPEDSEQLELLEQIEPVLARARGKVYSPTFTPLPRTATPSE